jgi:hypothetical protein
VDETGDEPSTPKPLAAFLADLRVGHDQQDDAPVEAELQQLGAVLWFCERVGQVRPPDHDGLPLDQFPAPIRQLRQDLGELSDRLREAATNRKLEDRPAAVLQLVAVMLFLRKRFPLSIGPLMNLGNALSHLDDNVTMPMLKPTPTPLGGKPPLTQTELQRHGVIAAAVDLIRWSKTRMSLQQAADEVVALARNGRPLPSSGTVLQWRKDALKAPWKRSDAATYHQLLDEARTRMRAGTWAAAQLRAYATDLLAEPWP